MKRFYKHAFFKNIFFLWLTLPFFMNGQNKVGTSAAPFLGIPIGPRAHAMGGAHVAAVNDVTAAFWNPGALSRIDGTEITVSHANWLLDTDLNWIGLNVNMGTIGALAIRLYTGASGCRTRRYLVCPDQPAPQPYTTFRR